MREEQNQSSLRQSKELEDLLSKLYGKPVENKKSIIDSLDEEEDLLMEAPEHATDSCPLELPVDLSDEHDFSEPAGVSATYSACASLNESFFDEDSSRDMSGPLPVGSGSFARVPSGGFHLVWESVKSACQNVVSKVRTLASRRSDRRQPDESAHVVSSDINNDLAPEQKKKLIAYAITAALIVGIAAIIASVVAGHEECPEMVPVAATGADAFEIQELKGDNVAEEDPDGDLRVFDPGGEISIPMFEEDGQNQMAQKTAPEGKTAPVAPVVAGNNRLTEARLYAQKDNVMANLVKGESFKTKKGCVMRQGPASKFGLVKEIRQGTTIQVLTVTEEDWVLENGSVWQKAGEAPRLGPGTMFAPAQKGMSVPQGKARVISAKNWRYVQVDGLYGYVGPACFKP